MSKSVRYGVLDALNNAPTANPVSGWDSRKSLWLQKNMQLRRHGGQAQGCQQTRLGDQFNGFKLSQDRISGGRFQDNRPATLPLSHYLPLTSGNGPTSGLHAFFEECEFTGPFFWDHRRGWVSN